MLVGQADALRGLATDDHRCTGHPARVQVVTARPVRALEDASAEVLRKQLVNPQRLCEDESRRGNRMSGRANVLAVGVRERSTRDPDLWMVVHPCDERTEATRRHDRVRVQQEPIPAVNVRPGAVHAAGEPAVLVHSDDVGPWDGRGHRVGALIRGCIVRGDQFREPVCDVRRDRIKAVPETRERVPDYERDRQIRSRLR